MSGVEIVSAGDGRTVYRVGSNLNGAANPIEPMKLDPAPGLMAELEAQKRVRKGE